MPPTRQIRDHFRIVCSRGWHGEMFAGNIWWVAAGVGFLRFFFAKAWAKGWLVTWVVPKVLAVWVWGFEMR